MSATRQTGFLLRLARYYPVLLLVIVLIGLDQALLFRFRRTEEVTAARVAPVNALTYAKIADPARPHLIILGSSRGRDAVDPDELQSLVADRGLPHQVFNLSQGDGGTPSALLADLATYTSLFERLPAGSKVFYIISPFEMNYRRDITLVQTAEGRAMLDRFVVAPDNWAHQLREVSGFARWASRWHWRSVPLVDGPLRASAAPQSLPAFGGEACNYSGLLNWSVLPINDWALHRMAERLAGKLVLLSPPLTRAQIELDTRFGLTQGGAEYFTRFAAETGTPYLASFGPDLHLGAEHFFKNQGPDATAPDCDHIGSQQGRRAVAESIVKLLQ